MAVRNRRAAVHRPGQARRDCAPAPEQL